MSIKVVPGRLRDALLVGQISTSRGPNLVHSTGKEGCIIRWSKFQVNMSNLVCSIRKASCSNILNYSHTSLLDRGCRVILFRSIVVKEYVLFPFSTIVIFTIHKNTRFIESTYLLSLVNC